MRSYEIPFLVHHRRHRNFSYLYEKRPKIMRLRKKNKIKQDLNKLKNNPFKWNVMKYDFKNNCLFFFFMYHTYL